MNDEIFKSIINAEELHWEDSFLEIDFDLITRTNGYKLMFKAFNQIYIRFIHNKIGKYDLDYFVKLCRRIAKILDNDIEYVEQKLSSDDGRKLEIVDHNILYGSIVTFLSYDKAKAYKHKMMKDGKFYFHRKEFNSFIELYVYLQSIITSGMLNAIGQCEEVGKLLTVPCKM